MDCSSVGVIVQISALLRKILATYVSKRPVLSLMFTFRLKNSFFIDFMAPTAKPFLRPIFLLESSLVPRNLHYFQLLSPSLLMIYSSVLLMFTLSLLSVNTFGSFSFVSLKRSSLVVTFTDVISIF